MTMPRRIVICRALLALGLLAAPAHAADLTDATGDRISLPDQPHRVLPAGPPAAILLAAVAPDLMLGWPRQPDPAAAYLPQALAALPEIPRLSGRDADVPAILAQTTPDLVIDYGDTAPRYAALARRIRAAGTPALLIDGSLPATPAALRLLGQVLHHEPRAELLARLAEALLATQAGPPRRAMYLRGDAVLIAAAPDSTAAALFHQLGWTLLAPPGSTPFRPVTTADLARLDPDIIVLGDPGWRTRAATDPAFASLRATRTGGLLVAPALPFEIIAEPPSLNRLLGLGFLTGADLGDMFALFSASFCDRVPTPATLARVRAEARPIRLQGAVQ